MNTVAAADRPSPCRWLIAVAALAVAAPACTDPHYLYPGTAIEVMALSDVTDRATMSLDLPIRLEEEDELTERTELATALGVEVPYVRRGDLAVSLEWTIKNLLDTQSQATLMINGGNEWFFYDPDVFIIDPDEEEPLPALLGGVPMLLDPYEIRSGVFAEDRLDEASLDLELISRGGLSPITAMLVLHEELTEFTDIDGLITYPEDVFAQMVRYTLVVEARGHVVLEYVVRVRDHRGILHEELLDAPPEDLTAFAPTLIE